MTSFQIGSLALLAIALVATLTVGVRRRMSPRVTIAWSMLWIAAGVAIAWPETTVAVANALGIARGADLVLYVAILGMFLGFFLVHVRLRRFESEITRVVRELAIRTPALPAEQEDAAAVERRARESE